MKRNKREEDLEIQDDSVFEQRIAPFFFFYCVSVYVCVCVCLNPAKN